MQIFEAINLSKEGRKERKRKKKKVMIDHACIPIPASKHNFNFFADKE